MKKSLAMMVVLIMVCALPGIASANGGGCINGAGITKDAVFIELQDITFADSVKVELFSDKTLLTTATLNTDKLGASSYPYLTCCIATETADEYWKLTEWTPRDKIVPNKAVLFVDDQEMDTMTFKLDAEKWADLPGTVPYSGSINGACITQNAVSIELEDITFEKSVQVKLFSGETLLTTATLNVNEDILKANTYYQFVTCCIPTEGADDKAWSLTPWIPRDNIIPTKAVLFVDDHEMDTEIFTLNAKEWAALPGTVLPSSGSIERAGITHASGVLKNAVSVDLKNVNFESSVQVQLYSGETLLTTATLQGVNPGRHDFLTCCIATETADANWALTPWTPKDDVVPNKVVLFVDGNKMDTMEFTLDAAEWKALPGTVLPSSGSTTGGESYWHSPVTPAPVPVVVIPPKTGDMTIWQSILHFFGVI